MRTLQEAVKLAIGHLDRAIDEPNNTMSDGKALKEIMRQLNLAKAVLGETMDEQPAQDEPVAWADMDVRGEDKGLSWTPGHFHKTPLYTRPQAREPLTDEQIHDIYDEVARREPYNMAVTRRNIARAIEAAHGIGEKK